MSGGNGAATWLGLARSLALYYGVPGRGRRLKRFYAGLLAPGDLCFDIGAHVGHRVRAALAVGARVVAVEPQPACLRLLRLLYGSDPRVALVGEAVGARPGRARLHISRRTPTVTSISRDWIREVAEDPGFGRVRWDAAAEVAVTTLDLLIERYGCPAFAKLDIEGSEPEALSGLSHCLPHISFEALPAAPANAHACVARLTQLGDYRFNLERGEDARFAWPDWVDAATLIDRLQRETRPGDVHARLGPSPAGGERR